MLFRKSATEAESAVAARPWRDDLSDVSFRRFDKTKKVVRACIRVQFSGEGEKW